MGTFYKSICAHIISALEYLSAIYWIYKAPIDLKALVTIHMQIILAMSWKPEVSFTIYMLTCVSKVKVRKQKFTEEWGKLQT